MMELYTTKEILGILTRNRLQIAVNQGTFINPTLRLNNYKHTKKNEHWQKIFQKKYSQERILTVAFHTGESSMTKYC